MRTFKLSFLLTVLLSMVGANVFAQEIAVENDEGVTIYYNFIKNNTELTVVSDNRIPRGSYSGELIIPAEVQTQYGKLKVTSIEMYAFYFCYDLTSVSIPNSVTSINYISISTMGYNGLTSITIAEDNPTYDSRDNCNAIIETATNTLVVGCKGSTIPSSVTAIGNCAFANCDGLTSVTIPGTVESIGEGAFFKCGDLESVTIENGVKSIDVGAFSRCYSLSSIFIPKSVTSIGTSVFADCFNLNSITVDEDNEDYDSRKDCNAIIETATHTLLAGCKNSTIPNGVASIAPYALQHSGLTSISIPKSVTSIGESAFYGCAAGLTSIIVADGNPVYDSRNSCNAIIETATNTLLLGCQNTVIPNDVKSIGSSAFGSCDNLKEIIIPNSVTSIGHAAFSSCGNLTSVTIGSSVTSIGSQAFDYCYNLTEVTSLIENPFTTSVFYNGFNNATLYVPKGTKELYQNTDGWNRFGNIVEISYDLVTLSSVGKGTYCSEYDLDFTDVEGLKAYIASGYDYATGTVLLTRVMKVPAGTGVMLMGTEGTYQVPYCDAQFYYVNMLKGILVAQTLPPTEGIYTNYLLKNGDDGVLFYKVMGQGTVAAHRAYLQIPTVAAEARTMLNFMIEDETTGTDTTGLDVTLMNDGERRNKPFYNLNGQRVEQPKHGIYIQNGKKVIIR